MGRGDVVTFYSYKGGVGRSFALANVAVILASWGYRVLCVDWDLEAPGLHAYFKEATGPSAGLGLIHLLGLPPERARAVWRECVIPVDVPGRLSLLASGNADPDYAERLQAVDWERLYSEDELGTTLELIRQEWLDEYDLVLLDSRTGISDVGGICTVQLPDVLVLLFTANRQSLDGALEVADKAARARAHLPYDRGRLLVVPVTSRFDAREEYRLAETWRQQIVEAAAPVCQDWVPREVEVSRVLERLTLPYLSYWSFGEGLPALTETRGNPDSISYYLESLAALLAHRVGRVDLLAEHRDSFVGSAARRTARSDPGPQVFISYAPGDDDVATELADRLRRRQVGVGLFDDRSNVDGDWAKERDRALSQAQHLIAIIGRHASRAQEHEIARFLRQTLDDGSERSIFPLLVDSSPDRLPSLLRRTQYHSFTSGSPERARILETLAAEVADLVHGT